MTIDSVVKNLQWYTGREGKDYLKLLGLVSRGISEIKKMGDANAIERAETNLSDLTNGVWPYPKDALKVVDVYYNEANRLFPIPERKDVVFKDTYDFPLPYYKTVSDVREIKDEYTRNFSIPGGRCKYYYTDDKENRRLIFDKTADEYLWMFYVGTGVDESLGEDTMIPSNYQPVLEQFVLWKLASLENRKEDSKFHQMEYNTEIKKMKYFNFSSLEKIKNEIYQTYSQGPSR